jgi:hypothetical protein
LITTDEMRILLSINGAASYTTTINEVTNVTNKYEKSVGNLISTLAKLVSVGAIVKFGKQCIEAASDLQEVANVVDVTFGKTAGVVNDWAKQQAASFGLSETAAKRYIGTYGTMAKQFNMTEEQAAQMGIELTKLTGDVASFYNLEDKAAATKLKAIFTGETEGLKELGVVMTETQLQAYALSNGLDKPLKQMTEQEKVLLRYRYTMEKLSHAQGDFMRTSDGYANSVRTLKLNLENLKIEIGNELIPVAAQGIGAIADVLKVVGPAIVTVAQTIRLYAQAWAQTSSTIKTVVVISGVAIGVFILWPKVVAIATAAQRLLTTEIVSTGMAIRYTLGVLGIFLAMLALLDIANTASELGATEQIENLGKSADVSTGTVDTLADSLDNLGESSKGLETFLASFDEVNKVGGGNSLMSSLVTKDDLANILGAATGISDLQNELNSLTMPDITGGIFSAEWWEEKKEMIFGFLDTIGTHEFVDNWKSGIMDIDSWLAENMPRWHSFFTNLGADIYDALHPDAEKDTRETFTYISSSGRAVEGLKYNDDGTLTQAYLNQMQNTASSGTSTQQTVTSTTTTQPVDITLMLDGRTIASVVSDYQNQRARSSGNQSLVGG